MRPTPTENDIPFQSDCFLSLSDVLDYAAGGNTGYNFYNKSCDPYDVIPYASLRDQARDLARRLLGLNVKRGDRIALVADTHPDFIRFFFACQYAGLVPVPLPAVFQLGGQTAYVNLLRRLLLDCDPSIALAPPDFVSFLTEASEGMDLLWCGSSEAFSYLPRSDTDFKPSTPGELAYLQYTSGSTRFPRGVMISQETVIENLRGIAKYGVKMGPRDRIMSWLPFYHDMGLVGLVLGPMICQRSVDFLATRDFAMRPRLWLKLIDRNHSSISYSPPFGYELCVKGLRPGDIEALNLRSWRIAGVGAETIRFESLSAFAKKLRPAGFNKNAFLACYGMAECTLAVSFASRNQGILVDRVDADLLAKTNKALPISKDSGQDKSEIKDFVKCGAPLPGYEIQVRDEAGCVMPDRHCGTLFVRGPSVMSGYFREDAITRQTLSAQGWLNTGDMAYLIDHEIVITGRKKDLIIINGRNIWPQDMEKIAELQPGLRTGDASAFSISAKNHNEIAIMAVECRTSDEVECRRLIRRLQAEIFKYLGITCFIELVPRHTLPRTTSGKLSRSRAKKDFLNRLKAGETEDPFARLDLPYKKAG